MTTKNSKKEQNLFHLFIQSADRLPMESKIFPYFQFMDKSIRKKFNQLKKTTNKKQKELTCFEQLWDDLDNDDKVNLYCNWTKLLNQALEIQKNPRLKNQIKSLTLQDQIYIKKTSLFNKWEKRNVKLTATQFIIISSSRNKEFDLKDYEVRKSKSRENFAWVFQPINKFGKELQCGVSSQTMFDEWFNACKSNVNNQRVIYFYNSILQERQNPGSVSRKFSQFKVLEAEKTKNNKKQQNIKTLTQRMIDKQMRLQQNDVFSQTEENEQFDDFEDKAIKKTELMSQSKPKSKQEQKKIELPSNPNIFKRLVPQYRSLMNFADTPVNSALLHCGNDFRIYELPFKSDQQIVLKFFTVLPFPKTLIFQAIGSQSMGWNQQIDLLTVKTKISSENTALIYQKNKSHGILYRQRDFLYLRHCFSILNFKQKNTFMIDKSIDSIHHPPFMTVVRAEKQLIWGLIQKESGKECILIVQGWINGGGYMNAIQNKEMTFKYMKKLSNLSGFVKQISFQQFDKASLLFKQDWVVDITKEEVVQRKGSNYSQQKNQQKQVQILNKNKSVKDKNEDKQQKQLAQFMIRTNEELGSSQMKKSQVFTSQQRIFPQNYVAPPLNQDRCVSIPQIYLKKTHIMSPKQKSKKPKYFPPFRGHHLWKGEWEVQPNGGLAYVDAQKMQQQKKVLTYIIKRIGRNIFSGKGILNISLPVDIFCVQSNIQRLAMSFGYFPHYLQKAAQIKEPQIQLKYVIGSGMASSLIYLTMQKPFNPILGETYQCWIDNCPIYFEQISHHPPVAAFLMKGRGYTVSGCVQAKMDLSINSGTGNNEGIFKVQFDNGNNFYYTTPAGCLTGLTYGDRRLNLVGKSFYWSDKGLFLQINYNPSAKTKGFFGSAKGEGDEKLADYFEGQLKLYSPNIVKQICTKRVQNKEISIIPKGAPNSQPSKILYKISGRWNKFVMCGDQKIFDVDQNRYYCTSDQKYPLASHSNYRQDIVYRRLKNFVTSQDFKQILEVKQREDRKLRTKFGKTSSH